MDRDLLIQQIYDAAAMPELWPAALEGFGRTVGTPAVALLTRRSDSWIGSTCSMDMASSLPVYLQSDVPTRTQTTARLLAADRAGFVASDDVYTPDEWELDPFRREWGKAWGWDRAAATAIQIPSGDFVVVHAQRRDGEPGFNARDVATLDSFRPHLARAGFLAGRWRLQRLRAAAEALALVGLPAAVLDRDARVLAANSLIEEAKGHVRWLPRDRLALADPPANQMLLQALAGLFDPSQPAVNSFASRSRTGAAVIHVVPTTGHAREIFDGGLAIVVLTPVTAPDAPDLTLIRALFDLSASEARVARGLTRGRTVEQIAEDAGVTRETVRSQVKAVMAKTGTSRQAEIAALLAGLPRLPAGEDDEA
ncbi:MAG: helix-turn-helix transcriptional regulator [Rhodospirillales bacterium]|nr:helix-turn-helix transcriptional regulator [Rhodospirillales bacterium]